jgi:hypothetical protein
MTQRRGWEARIVVAVVLGAIGGYAIGTSLANDAAKAETLTFKQYADDFERYKTDLAAGEMPMAAAVITGTVLIVAALGVYELLVFGLTRIIGGAPKRPEEVPWERST